MTGERWLDTSERKDEGLAAADASASRHDVLWRIADCVLHFAVTGLEQRLQVEHAAVAALSAVSGNFVRLIEVAADDGHVKRLPVEPTVSVSGVVGAVT